MSDLNAPENKDLLKHIETCEICIGWFSYCLVTKNHEDENVFRDAYYIKHQSHIDKYASPPDDYRNRVAGNKVLSIPMWFSCCQDPTRFTKRESDVTLSLESKDR